MPLDVESGDVITGRVMDLTEKESGIDEGDRRRKRKRRRDLGDDVRRHQVFKPRKAIAQNKLPLLQALNLELIGGADVLEGVDGGIQIAMLLPQEASDSIAGAGQSALAVYVVLALVAIFLDRRKTPQALPDR